MEPITIILPNQLFRHHPGLEKGCTIILVEETLFFRQFRFHKKKLMLHRASMKHYSRYLTGLGYQVRYIEASHPSADISRLIEELGRSGCSDITMADPVDDWISRRAEKACNTHLIKLKFLKSPSFMNSMEDVADFFQGRKGYFQTEFYIWQRKQQNILLEKDGKPMGGKWSFDAENRNRFPKGEYVPAMPWVKTSAVEQEASDYVNLHFPENPGTTENFGYPCTFDDAEHWLEVFLQDRLDKFGTYEDAMVEQENFLYHSILTPMLNTGLLTPQEIVSKALEHAEKNNTPLNAIEGFVRQIIGWREFIRIVYEKDGRKQRITNYFNFKRPLPPSFWTGTTGIAPVDQVIRHTLDHSYTHHINRLMVLGNFMLLCEFDPQDVYRWFMEMYIDAYDWVMVPNVYGMSQYADGGMMTTKPYISGSNYLIKMGNWQKGDWQVTWDGLFWRFMDKHRPLFSRNPRMGMLLNTFDKMDPQRKKTLLEKAEGFLMATGPK